MVGCIGFQGHRHARRHRRRVEQGASSSSACRHGFPAQLCRTHCRPRERTVLLHLQTPRAPVNAYGSTVSHPHLEPLRSARRQCQGCPCVHRHRLRGRAHVCGSSTRAQGHAPAQVFRSVPVKPGALERERKCEELSKLVLVFSSGEARGQRVSSAQALSVEDARATKQEGTPPRQEPNIPKRNRSKGRGIVLTPTSPQQIRTELSVGGTRAREAHHRHRTRPRTELSRSPAAMPASLSPCRDTIRTRHVRARTAIGTKRTQQTADS